MGFVWLCNLPNVIKKQSYEIRLIPTMAFNRLYNRLVNSIQASMMMALPL